MSWIVLLSVQYIRTFYLSEVGTAPPGYMSTFSVALTIFTAVAFAILSIVLVVEQKVLYVGIFYLFGAVTVVLFGCGQFSTTVMLCRRLKELDRKLCVVGCADKR